MSSEPIILDLFCGQGGAAKGYIDAGFRVIGVDIADHSKRYPGEFIQGDALKALAQLIGGVAKDDIAAVHASPPCQGYTIATPGNPSARSKYRRLIAATRTLLELTDLPWVIENVEQARRQMVDPVLLCGRMFGLKADDEDGMPLVLDRHRLFESNIQITAPEHPKHHERHGGYVPRSIRVQQELLGIDWMTVKGMQESIPPVYAEHIGTQLLAHIEERTA